MYGLLVADFTTCTLSVHLLPFSANLIYIDS